MHHPALMTQGLGQGLLVTLLVLALSACEGGGGGQEQANKPRPLPEVEKALRPGGEYRTEEFKPSFSFRVSEGWAMETDPPEGPNELEITWRRGTMNLFIMNVQEVYEPIRKGTPDPVDAPKDMVGWLEHHPYLRTVKQEPVTVGGVEGVQFDWVVAEDSPYEEINTFRYSDGSDAAAAKGYKYRAIILEDVEGEAVTIGIGSPASEFKEFLPEAQKVLDTVKWAGS